ncbi:MAG: ATP-binding protein [Solirubrobacterales bacterium]
MATKAKAKKKADSSANPAVPDPDKFEFGSPNEPNADILLESLRSAGYSLSAAVGDFLDNSIDAEASTIIVNVGIDKSTGLWAFEVADDGFGMPEPVLDEMMRLGSRSVHDLTRDLGAFGLGSDTAALGIGQNKHVITCHKSGEALSSMWDLGVIRRERSFVKHLGPATNEERALYASAFSAASVEPPAIGTVVRITKCDRTGWKYLKPAVAHIRRYIAQTYRRFLVPGGALTVIVNGEKVKPFDPLMRDHSDTLVMFDESVEFQVTLPDDSKRTETLSLCAVHLPDMGGEEANEDAKITISTEGLYVQRNGREILSATTLGLFTRHSEYSRFRAEINIPGSLDSELGVSFLKSNGSLEPSQALKEKIKQVMIPYLNQSRRHYKKSSPKAKDSVKHEGAQQHIKAKSAFLRKPDAEIEERERGKGQPEGKERKEGDSGRIRSPRENAQKALADEADFRAEHRGPHAPFYEGDLEGRKVVVTYNADHPAYERLILENRDNLGQVAAIDYLVWSLVSAELRNVDPKHWGFVERMRIDSSFNLRQLLT